MRALFHVFIFVAFFAMIIAPDANAQATTALPASTAIPVRFDHSISADKFHVGDTVTATTLQVVLLPGGKSISRGSVLTGHIVNANGFQLDSSSYAHQAPSILSIHFDRIQSGNIQFPVNLSLRAIADPILSTEALTPHYNEEEDARGTMRLIGGDEFDPFNEPIRNAENEIIGYNRKHGVFARLIAASTPSSSQVINCPATEGEQSVALFSPRACGIYGLANTYLNNQGLNGTGIFTLESHHHSVKIDAGSTALFVTVQQTSTRLTQGRQ